MSRDYLGEILERKQGEVRRRRAHATGRPALVDPTRGARAVAALVRPQGALPHVVAEVKFQSPSAGPLRTKTPGEAVRVARAYEQAGASAISVLCDGPGFAGSPLDLRRVAAAVAVPVLFKEFVLDPVQVWTAARCGASMVLLLVRALPGAALDALIDEVRRCGMEPVVEAADADELERALTTSATIVGVNARDLRTFQVDMAAARAAMDRIPRDRVAVFMSGVKAHEDLVSIGATRADAVLVGEGLMRAPSPGERLRALRGVL